MTVIHKSQQPGFTLVEIMIALALIAILASIALPSYTDVIQSTRRSEAREALSDFAARQESFFLNNKTYSTTISALGRSASTENGHYVISIPAANALTYTLTATAQASQSDDTECTTMSVTSVGHRSPDNCW